MKLLLIILLFSFLLFGGCFQQQKPVLKPVPPTAVPTPEFPVQVEEPVKVPSPAPLVQDELLTDDIDQSLADLDLIGDLNLSDSLPLDLED